MSIGSIGSSSSMMMQVAQGGRARERPDPAQMAENLFAKLDSSGQGYLDKSDLQAALDKASSSSSSTSGALDIDGLMAQLDGNGDGKITESEFANKLKGARSGAHHAGGRHGPPPPQQDDDPNAPDSASGSAAACAAGAPSTDDASSKAMMQIMRLVRAYSAGSDSSRNTASQVAVTA